MAISEVGAMYPFQPWTITEEAFDFESNPRDETIFALGNGYIGMRGNFEEGFSGPALYTLNGTYLNGFYDSAPIIHGEAAYGYARNRQTMLNVTESRLITLTVDGEKFEMHPDHISGYRRVLDMREGTLKREVVWQSHSGKQLKVTIERLVSLPNKHLAAIDYTIEALNFDGRVTLCSAINAEVYNQVTAGDPRSGSSLIGQVLGLEEKIQEGNFCCVRQRTKTTQFALVCAAEHHLAFTGPAEFEIASPDQQVQVIYHVDMKKGEVANLQKYISYFTSKDYDQLTLVDRARSVVTTARDAGFAELKKKQTEFLDRFWANADVEIEGDEALQQGIRFNLFHLLQSAGKDGRTNIGAKGITGEGYEGHYFWDTETYVFPVFLYTNPDMSRKLIEHRYSLLEKARERARELDHRGALYAWRTIDGEETSAFFPAGTAQYHINADIIHALKKYVTATGDLAFLHNYGAEMLFETARFWTDLGAYIPNKGFCLNMVTGPDEYTACVDNNAYTNLMAKENLTYAVQVAEAMRKENPAAYERIRSLMQLEDTEIEDWRKAADSMYLKYDKERGILAQDETFLDKAVWNFHKTPRDKYPLLLHYHYLNIYRHQVLKQADVVLALLLQWKEFTLAEKKRNFDYYERLTTHDSSLSCSVHAIIAAEIGYEEKAYSYFMQTARMDLDDYHRNTKDGIHSAAMAGSWLAIVNGFAGMREHEGRLYFNPTLPVKWESYSFAISYLNARLRVRITRDNVEYTLLEGSPFELYHEGKPLALQEGKAVSLSRQRSLGAVIFDLDGVITDTAEHHFIAWKAIADEIGAPFDREFNEHLKGVGRMESLELILKNAPTIYTAAQKAELARRKNDAYTTSIKSIKPTDLLPGIKDLLIELRERGVKVALASASRNAETVLNGLQVRDLFDCVVDGNQVGKGKPDPEVFMIAAERLGVPARNCIGVEDAAAGVESIKGANMLALGIGAPEILASADVVIGSTRELTVNLLENMIKSRIG